VETRATPSRAIRSYEDIEAFQRAMGLLKTVHDLVLRFPDFEKFDLVQQMRRACKSIPANIAEGYSKRSSTKHFKHYLSNALGSTNEMIVHMQIAQKLGYVPREEANELIADYRIVGKQ
jgi:four helix bundle protein